MRWNQTKYVYRRLPIHMELKAHQAAVDAAWLCEQRYDKYP
jgi:hypothetical protein